MTNQQGAQEAPKVRTADYEAGWKDGYKQGAWAAQQPAPSPAQAVGHECQGIPRTGCNYLAACGRVCNKCGEVHSTRALTAQADTQPAQQGVSYAALPESFLEIPDVQDESGINAYYSREVVLECIDAALASHGQALRLLTQKEKDSLGRRAEGMDGNEWDQWVQEKFAQVNGLKVQGGSYEWDWE